MRQHQQSRSCHAVVPAVHSVDPGVVAAASVTRSPCSLDNRQQKNHCHSSIIHAAPVRQHQQSRSRQVVHPVVHTPHITPSASISNTFWAAVNCLAAPVWQQHQSRSRHTVQTINNTQQETAWQPRCGSSISHAVITQCRQLTIHSRKPPGSPGVAAASVTQSPHIADN